MSDDAEAAFEKGLASIFKILDRIDKKLDGLERIEKTIRKILELRALSVRKRRPRRYRIKRRIGFKDGPATKG